MRKNRLLAAGAVIVVAAIAGAYLIKDRPSSSGTAAWAPEAATPSGVTLQYLAAAKTRAGFFVQGIAARGDKLVYADDHGKTLYTFDKDATPGQSACTGDCATGWPPATVAANTKAFGAWTIVDRQGSKQWALHGKPLYTCANETAVGEAKCNGADHGAWHAAMFRPAETMQTPPGIQLEDVVAAPGQALTNSRGMTLYVYTGDVRHSPAVCAGGGCQGQWVPVQAAELANPVGDFTAVAVADGTRQWAYKGRLLYTYAGDIENGDVLGTGNGWAAAMALQYYMPPNTAIHRPLGYADILTTGDGMTLYKRDESFQLVTGHGLPHSIPGIPAMGRAIGTEGCDAECLKIWHPFLAPADAKAAGFWEIANRADGSRQWVYKGYTLYTYGADKKPGDLLGDQIYDVAVDDGKHPDVVDLVPTTNGAALYWSYIEP